MYAIFELSGFQFSGSEGDILEVPTQKGSKGDKVSIAEVLLLKDKETIHVGTPFVEGAAIEAEIVGSGSAEKVLIYKYKRRTKYRRTQGHRQQFSLLKISNIVTAG